MDEPILTGRLTLEPLAIEHATEMVDVLASELLYTFTGGEAPTEHGLRERYERQIAGSGRADEVWKNWIIRTLDDGRAVGFVQADINGSCAELAWVLGVEHQGRGFASEAVAAVQGVLMNEGATLFEAFIHPGHAASQAVARRAGMARTGEVDDDGEDRWATENVDSR